MSTAKTPVKLIDLFRYFRSEPHQLAAIQELGELIPASLLHKSNNWYRTWTQDGKQPDPDWLWPALSLIREFEGCKLKAYPDPGTGGEPWTIGWGSTRLMDGAVEEGDEISQTEADELLRWEVEKTAREVFRIFPEAKQWPGNRISALISFVYNVGSGAAEGSTLRKRFAAGEDPNQVVAEELPRWNKANGQELAGLTRRRMAEVKAFTGRPVVIPELQQPAKITPKAAFAMHLTPHFTLGEFALNQEVRRFQHQHQIDTAAELAAFLERVRQRFGRPIRITSGYRPPAINRSAGGASNSEHLYAVAGEGAVDITMDGDLVAVEKWVDAQWPYSVGYGATKKGFIHIGRRANGERRRWSY